MRGTLEPRGHKERHKERWSRARAEARDRDLAGLVVWPKGGGRGETGGQRDSLLRYWRQRRSAGRAGDPLESASSDILTFGDGRSLELPDGTGLGICPELDTSTDPSTPVRLSGELVFTDAGSTAGREKLSEYQPVASLDGHTHESRAAANMGNTHALNPGSTHQEGVP